MTASVPPALETGVPLPDAGLAEETLPPPGEGVPDIRDSIDGSDAPDRDFVLGATAIEGPVGEWPDAWLVAAIRGSPPNSLALDELAQRHWRSLFGHCQMITLNRADACDLAQEAWCRVLRSRQNLKPEGNFPAYLHTVAMNLWRDRCRAESRAGPLAANRVVSLEGSVSDLEDDTIALADAVPDLALLEAQQQARLMADIDEALSRLAPLLRGVLVARFLMGESCAEIGRRHGRTEQTASGWVRQGVQEMKKHLQDIRDGHSQEKSS